MRGSTPLARSVNSSHSWQNSPSPQVIHSSSANSPRSTSARPASRCPTGIATSAGSSRIAALTRPSGSGIGLLYQSSTTARSRSPRTTPATPASGSSSLRTQPQPRMIGAQSGERGGKQPARGRRERGQPQLAHHLPALRLQVGLGELDLGQDPRGMVGEQPPGVGEPHPPPVLGEQLLPDLALQLGHLLGDGRRGDVQPVGRAADRAVAGEGVEGTQALQIQHVSNATRYWQKISLVLRDRSASSLGAPDRPPPLQPPPPPRPRPAPPPPHRPGLADPLRCPRP